ncbi:MAG: carboxypeptidase-like regulatory domain-containing protein [archaeon]|nr:carboxypeptidase-like regulatory domain-containing protein [archaeon]
MTVNVIVYEKLTKKPVPFVIVRIESGKNSYTDDTNIRGIAEFQGIHDGKYNIKIRHKDYRPYTEKMFISRNSIINIGLHQAFE